MSSRLRRTSSSGVWRLLVLCCVALLTAALPARATEPDTLTWTAFPLPTLTGEPLALAWHDGMLFAGGKNVVFGNTMGLNAAILDGVHWRSASDGLYGCAVQAFAEYGGGIAAGGWSSPVWVNSYERQSVFVWNGAKWVCIGWTNDSVDALAEYGGELYAAGAFTTVNRTVARFVARWDGVAWHAADAGMPVSGKVRSLTVHQGLLVAGGDLGSLGSVAQWDGTQWTRVGAGLDRNGAPGVSTAKAVVSSGTKLYASGDFTHSGGDTISRTAVWDGSSWASLPNVAGSSDPLAVHGGQLVANAWDGTSQYPQFWDGSVWHAFGPPTVTPNAYASNGATLFAAGREAPTNAGLPWRYGLSAFEGGSWSPRQEAWTPDMKGLQGPAYCIRSFHGQLFAGGEFEGVATGTQLLRSPQLARWTGTNWEADSSAGPVTAFESWRDSLVSVSWHSVRVWNGTTWRALPAIPHSYTEGLAVHDGELYVLGMKDVSDDTVAALWHWTGAAWIEVPNQVMGAVSVGASWGGDLVCAGDFTAIGSTVARNIARWDGAAFHPLGGGVNEGVTSMLADSASLVVGGFFTEVGGAPLRGVARWDGSQWHTMGTRAVTIACLRKHAGQIYACGTFVGPSVQAADAVARWNGSDWDVLAPTIGGDSYSIDFIGDDLYVAGSFLSVGSKPTRHFAKLAAVTGGTAGVGGAPRPVGIALSVTPNPSRGAVEFTLTLPASGHARVTVHDVGGREVARLLDADHAAGRFTLAWDGAAAPGLYFATVEAAGGRTTSRLVRLR